MPFCILCKIELPPHKFVKRTCPQHKKQICSDCCRDSRRVKCEECKHILGLEVETSDARKQTTVKRTKSMINIVDKNEHSGEVEVDGFVLVEKEDTEEEWEIIEKQEPEKGGKCVLM